MDDKVMEELEFHQQTISGDDASPLHLIREKELAISGRILAAKREADEIVAEARRNAAKLTAGAEEQAAVAAAGHDELVEAQLEIEASRVRESAVQGATDLEKVVASRRPEAVKFLVESVISIK